MAFNLEYILNFDNISYIFVFLTVMLIPVCILTSWASINYSNHFILVYLLY